MLTLDDDALLWFLRMNRAQLVALYRDMEGTAEMITSRIPGLRETIDESLANIQSKMLEVHDAAEGVGMEGPTAEEIALAEVFARSLETVEGWEEDEEDWDALSAALVDDDPKLDRGFVTRSVRDLRRYLAIGAIVNGHTVLTELEGAEG